MFSISLSIWRDMLHTDHWSIIVHCWPLSECWSTKQAIGNLIFYRLKYHSFWLKLGIWLRQIISQLRRYLKSGRSPTLIESDIDFCWLFHVSQSIDPEPYYMIFKHFSRKFVSYQLRYLYVSSAHSGKVYCIQFHLILDLTSLYASSTWLLIKHE